MYVTAAGAGVKDGTTWAKAMGSTEFITDLTGSAEPGDIYYIAEGSYSVTATCTVAANGTAALPITLIGVKSGTSNDPPVYADYADTNLSVSATDERPVFACTIYLFTFTNYCKVYNLAFTGSGTSLVVTGTSNILYNVKSTNTGVATRYAFNTGTMTTLIKCYGESTNGYGVYSVTFGCSMLFCDFAHMHTGIYINVNGPYATIAFCGFHDGITGINMLASYGIRILNCSFWGITNLVSASSASGAICINNALQWAINGFIWTTQEDFSFFFNNHISNEGGGLTNPWVNVSTDPPHEDPDVTSGELGWSTNFALSSTTTGRDTGMSASLNVGL
jgi:hypothetical protein